MRAALMCAALLVSTPVLAEDPPAIIGSISNRAGGEIVFMTSAVNCPDGQRRGFTRGDGGKIDFWFCWMLIGDSFFVAYDEGDRYTYDLDNLRLSPEYRAYLDRKPGGAL